MFVMIRSMRRLLRRCSVVSAYAQSRASSSAGSPVLAGDIIKWKDTQPWRPPVVGGRVIKVYDGDTITIAAKLPYPESPLYRWSVRLSRIDTPEMKSKAPQLKEIAVAARDRLAARILQTDVQLRNVGTEKYGRVLADVYVGDECLNDWLLSERLAYAYCGQKKLTEEEQLRVLGVPPCVIEMGPGNDTKP
jgi:endonuclease YncB( thermonuclease family)